MSSSTLVLFIFWGLLCGNESSRILGVFDFNSKSHFQMSGALMKALAARGHQVVVVNHFPQSRPVPNYTDIDISGSLPDIVDNIDMETTHTDLQNGLSTANFLWKLSLINCRKVLEHQNMKDLLKSNDKFDMVITEIVGSECSAYLSYKFKAPLIGLVTCVPFPWIHGRLGNPDHPAYNPSYFVPYTSRMNFWQRLHNTLYNVITIIGNHFFNNVPTNQLLTDDFGNDIPSIEEITSNTSLILVNSHFSITDSRPAVPGYIEVGGLHVQQPKQLPQDIQKFLDESEHGVIYFSMGSLIKVQSFPQEKIEALLEAFAALPERVLMKYTGNQLPRKPDNVIIGKWLPQIDILCHPKTKLFITHGGLMSTQESVYAGVPILGIPLFADQYLNIARLKEQGMALYLDYSKLSKEDLIRTIRTLIDQKWYLENAKKVSTLFRDRPMTAMETAVYWVEYVIRHRGAPHLRSAAADMPLYQYLLLDVISVLLLLAITSAYVIYWVTKTILLTLLGSRSRRARRNYKQE